MMTLYFHFHSGPMKGWETLKAFNIYAELIYAVLSVFRRCDEILQEGYQSSFMARNILCVSDLCVQIHPGVMQFILPALLLSVHGVKVWKILSY